MEIDTFDTKDFISFFKKATRDEKGEGVAPFPYQIRLAYEKELPQLLTVPTGLGKTASVVLSWIWRRGYANDSIRSSAPRRLVYCLPMRVLVEQTTSEIRRWLSNLEILDDSVSKPKSLTAGDPNEGVSKIPVVVLMGGEDEPRWDDYPERDMIIVGTQDMLLSRALNRGYGMSRYRWPMQFGLLNNDCLWVFDEIQLMGPGVSTSAQLQGFREKYGNFFPARSLWMSATADPAWLQTADFDASTKLSTVFTLEQKDKNESEIQKRLGAMKVLKRAGIEPLAPQVADLVLAERKPGTLSLVVVNTVKRARAVYEALVKKDKKLESILLHSQFRPEDRRNAIGRLMDPRIPDRICVSTQVIEAGVNVSAHDLFTDIAPWTSVVQRMGRCNRFGENDDSKIYWIDVASDGKKESYLPYETVSMERSREILTGLEGRSTSPGSLPSLSEVKPAGQTIRKKDLMDLFDTTPDLAGNDIDISRFIRDTDDRAVKVFWRELIGENWTETMPGPSSNELCPAPIDELKKFLSANAGYVWDDLDAHWIKIRPEKVNPSMVVLLDSTKGGYSSNLGWNPSSKTKVVVLFDTPQHTSENERKYDGQSTDEDWKTIEEHTEQVKARIEGISRSLVMADDWIASLREAAKWHDAGKAHPEFQQRILIGTGRSADIPGPWAKAPKEAWSLRRNGVRRHFRHELLSGILAKENGCSDIVCYLAASHHGKVRMSLRSMPDEIVPNDPSKRFARGIWDGDEVPEFRLDSTTTVNGWKVRLDCMELGNTNGTKSWLNMSIGLRDDPSIGPFRLAFLEALIKAADERASGGLQ